MMTSEALNLNERRGLEALNNVDFTQRSEYLLSIYHQLVKDGVAICSIVQYHLNAAQQAVGQIEELTGPTGESNTLYTEGRGTVLLVQETQGEGARRAVIAQFTAALASGNRLIVCSDDHELLKVVTSYFGSPFLPDQTVLVAPFEEYRAMLQRDIHAVGYTGSQAQLITLNRELAQREGEIVGLVFETDLQQLPTSHDPRLSFRFVTERTRTINITAIGGNASLLELGSDEQ